jgi:FMN reductase
VQVQVVELRELAALRPLFAHLRALVVPTAVYAASEDWGGTGDALTDILPTRIERAGSELAGLMTGGAVRADGLVPVTRIA